MGDRSGKGLSLLFAHHVFLSLQIRKFNLEMNNNRRLLIYGAACVVVLAVAVSIFFVKLFSSSDKGEPQVEHQGNALLYSAVPSDAVLMVDAGQLGSFVDFTSDTASAVYGFVKENDPLHVLCGKIADVSGFDDIPMVISLHYSSKNEVSFFCAAELSAPEDGKGLKELFPFLDGRKKRYNNTDIYSYKGSAVIARYGDIILMSSSLYVLESSVRHLDNGISILDNPEFKKLYDRNSKRRCLYVNHSQIGKFFSGVMARGFLKYSDFFMRLASWSSFPIGIYEGTLSLNGVLGNGGDEKYHSSVLYGQVPDKSSMGDILPAETVFAFSLLLSDMQTFKDANIRFLDVHKKLSGYEYKKHLVDVEGIISSDKYTDSLEIEEVVSAYCRFGDRYEWLNFVKEKSSFGISDVVSGVMSKNEEIKVLPYIYKGYLGAVLGEAFTHCNEEAYCKVDGWSVIGPKDIVAEFASGSALYFNLEQYMEQTPLSDFLKKKGNVKIVLNLQEGKDSVKMAVKEYYRRALERNTDNFNFNFLTVNIGEKEGDVNSEIGFYAAKLQKLPQPEPVEEIVKGAFVDSTIVVDKGPFELVDFVKGGKCYLEQSANLKLRYLDGKKKGVWTIPFDTPICGSVAQIDYFKNGKLQMLFASENKLYLLDRLGRMVKGFPVTLADNVVYGPEVMDPEKDKSYLAMFLNEDNSISIYRLDKEHKMESVKIKAPEFVKELPRLKVVNGKKYLFLKTVSRLRVYSMLGKEVVIKDKKKAISPESEIILLGGDEIKVKGTDGKEFIFNLLSGKTRKV